MKPMKLAAILRIKDQILTIDECLTKLSTIVDLIIVLDNGSTDGTLEAYKKFPKVVKVLHTTEFDEGRDKIMLLDEAKKTDADWILWIDADEIFENHFTREVAESYMRSKYNRITFRMCNFWMNKKDCRYDGNYFLYTLHPQRSMWRNMPSAYFKNLKIHNGDIQGVSGPTLISPYRLKHYGYADPKKALEKMTLYQKVDPNGTRDYDTLIHTRHPYRTFRFYEFSSCFLNRLYIAYYKGACTFLWLGVRVWKKLVK